MNLCCNLTNEFLGGLDEKGHPKEVKIDERIFFKIKYNRMRIGDQVWVFRAIERKSGKCFLQPV